MVKSMINPLTSTSKNWKNSTTTWLVALFMLCGISNVFGQRSDCDSNAGGQLTVNSTCTFQTWDSNNNTDYWNSAAGCNAADRDDAWGWFDATSTSTTITYSPDSEDAVLTLFQGACSATMASVACADAFGAGGDETITFATTIGQRYRVRIQRYNSDGNMTGDICVYSPVPPPANDVCSGAITLTSNTTCTTTTGSTTGATDNNETGDCTTGTENAVWYEFQAVTSSHVVTVDGIAGFDAVVKVISACGSATTPTGGACVDVTGDNGIETLTLTGLTIGAFYKIQIHDFNGDLTANGFTVCVTHTSPPTITSLGAASGCVGSSLVINGTNLTGATAVTIGGTAATITGNTATTVTVTVGAGTTGTVQVTTPGGSATSAATFTVNPLPAAIGGGAATVCTGATTPAFTNATGGGTWSIINGTGSATISGGGIVTGVTTGTATVVYTLPTGCSISTPITVITTPTISANPANATTNIGGTANFSVTALNGPTSYTWQVSTDGGGSWSTVVNGGVYSGATTATLTITGATLAMNGYLYQASATNACGTSTYSTSASLTVSNLVLVSGSGVNNVTCGDNSILRDHNNLANYGNNRDDWSVLNVTSTAVVSLNGTYDTQSGSDGIILYDGVGIGGIQLAVYTGAGTINYTGNPGQTITIRFISNGFTVRPGFDLNITYSGNCNIPCVAPTALPTALSLSATGTVISGSFTHAVPQPDNYLVVISTNPVAPTPANGTTYTIGATVGAGYTVIANGSGNTFSATGLANSTTYYIYVFSFNRLCIGGPLYLGNLNGNVTTTASDPYCIPTSNVSTRYIENIFTVGAITNLNNMGTGRAPSGYADYTASTPVTQVPGGGVAIDYLLRVSRQYIEMWVDWNNDGTFADPGEMVYNSGAVQTIEGTGGFVVPIAQPLGTYRIRIRTREDSDIIAPCGNYTTGETEDYRLVVVADCVAKPVALYDGDRCDNGTVVLGVEGTPGVTEFRFYDSLYGGTLIGTQAAVPGITNWTTPFLTTTTKYYVTAFNGSCESWYREEIIAKVNPTANIVVTPSVPNVCGENNVVQIDAGGDVVIDYLVNEDFGDGTTGLGTMVRFNVVGQADANTQWTSRTSPYVPVGTVWKPAITSRAIGDGFALANSDFTAPNPKDTQLRTAVLDASAYSDLTLSFRHHFSYYPGEPVQFGYVDVSTDSGATWPTTLATYTSNQGFAGQFTNVSVDLTAFAGQPNLMVRFRYYLAGGSAWANGWAIDDVQVFGTRPLNTTFTWTGGTVAAFIDPACTIPYVAQSVTTVYVRPTALQLASPSWSFTANATLGNGCPISEFITITNSTKLWKGGTSADWYNANNWEPTGVPDANTCVYIYDGPNDSYINTSASDAYARIVTVRPNGLLQIEADNTLTVTDEVTVDASGTFNVENSGSLIQVNNVANVGNISMKRNVNVRKLDYVYWSSPVANFQLSAVSPGTSAGYRFKWVPTIGANINGWGNWTAANEAMVAGKGYIVRGPNSYTTVLQNFTANFVGVPNNGNINMPISRGVYDGVNYATGVSTTLATRDDDNWNLIGNPYPSAINANLFLAANTNIAGFIKFWTHGTLPSAATVDPFYNNYAQNYTVGDYITYNATGANPAIGNGNIAAGQGFFVLMNHSSAAATENVVFNNSMRRNDYRNDIFHRNANVTDAGNDEKHRIWLNLITPSATSSTTLVGYVAGATNEIDRMYDAPALDVKASFELYSFSNTDKLNIQGKALPFNNDDLIPLGIKISQNGIHTLGISTVDGLFTDASQSIYLEDKTLGITHDLRVAPYSFTATVGNYENRFVLKFNNETLGNEDFIANAVTVYTNESINVNTNNQTIQSVRVHDLLGRVLGTFNNVNATTFTSKNIAKTQSALLVEVTLENGSTKTYKVIF